MFVILPDYIADEIDKKLNAAITACPDAEKDRAYLRSELIRYVDEHGTVPDFTLGKTEEAAHG